MAAKREAAADLAKVAGERDLAKAGSRQDCRRARRAAEASEELEALPAPGKAFLRAVAKGEDTGTDDDPASKVAPVIDHRGDINEAATLIKMIRAGFLSSSNRFFNNPAAVRPFSCLPFAALEAAFLEPIPWAQIPPLKLSRC